MALPRKAGNDAGRAMRRGEMHAELPGSGAGKGQGGGHGVSGPPGSVPDASRPPHAPLPSRRGATSVVYSCEEKGTGTPYAAKILKKTVSVGGWGAVGGEGGALLCSQGALAPVGHRDRSRAVGWASLLRSGAPSAGV